MVYWQHVADVSRLAVIVHSFLPCSLAQLAADKGIKPWIQVLDMKDAGKAVQGVKDNKVRYRYVLKQDINQ